MLTDLSPGVNIVFGPQQSGKTTTVDAIQALLWPAAAAPRHASLFATLQIDGDEWIAELDGGRTRWQREGRDASPPQLPPAEQRDRYRLVLPELIKSDSQQFAAAIARETAGGYDLAAAGAAAGFRTGPSRPTVLRQRLEAARQRLKEARAAEARVSDAEAELPELRERLSEAMKATQRARLLEAALAHARAAEAERRAEHALQQFPPEMELLQPDDGQRLAELSGRIEAARAAIRQAEDRIREASDVLAQVGLEEGVPAGLLESLGEEIRLLEEGERRISLLEGEVARAARNREGVAASLGGVEVEQLARLDLSRLGQLEALSTQAAKCRQARAEAEAVLALADEAEESRDVEELVEGARLLSMWLRSPAPENGRGGMERVVGIAGLTIAAALAFLAGAIVHPGFHVLGVLLAIAALGLLIRRQSSDPRSGIVAEFRQLKLPEPRRWQQEEVLEQLRVLERDRARADAAAERAKRREAAVRALAEVEQAERALATKVAAASRNIGLKEPPPVESLQWLLERIGRWQEANDALEGAAAEAERVREQSRVRLEAIGGRLVAYGYPPPRTLSEAREQVRSLQSRQEVWRETSRSRELAREALRRGREEIAEAERSRARLRERLRIDEGAEEQVARWCAMLDRFHAADQALKDARTATRIARDALAALDEDYEKLLGLAPGVLEDALREELERAEGVQRIRDRITAVQTQIADALRRHDIEAALAEVENAEEEVRKARDRDIEAVVGDRLLNHIRERTRDERRPEVFNCARRWFGRITRGRCELEFTEDEPASFRARDTATGLGHSLAELSGGTRVQLLLSVRAAFVETHELGLRLPLLLDETLATADDHRASAIIDAVIAMARSGRQVFYFTAQADEVAKWQSALWGQSVPHSIVDLREEEERADQHAQGWLGLSTGLHAPPPIAGHDHLSYGRKLAVPPIDLLDHSVDSVHLWYLIEDLDVLRHCLTLGIERWGPLRLYVRSTEAYPSEALQAAFPSLQAHARAAEAFLSGCAIGRGRPVDRVVLEESGAVTPAFIEPVTELAKECEGDARCLLDSLRERRVKRFPHDRIEQLQAYLQERGYLDLRAPLAPDDLRVRILASVGQELNEGLLTPEQVHRLLARLTGQALTYETRPVLPLPSAAP